MVMKQYDLSRAQPSQLHVHVVLKLQKKIQSHLISPSPMYAIIKAAADYKSQCISLVHLYICRAYLTIPYTIYLFI